MASISEAVSSASLGVFIRLGVSLLVTLVQRDSRKYSVGRSDEKIRGKESDERVRLPCDWVVGEYLLPLLSYVK